MSDSAVESTPEMSDQSSTENIGSHSSYDSDVSENPMGDAVRAVEGKGKTQAKTQQQIEDMIELAGRKYKRTDLEKELANASNYKKGMHEAYEKAAKVVNNYKQLKESKDPIQVMKNLGYSEDQIDGVLQNYAEQKIKYAQMTKEQRETEQVRQENEQHRKMLQQFAQQQQQAQFQALVDRQLQDYDNQFKTHVEQRGLPYTMVDMREMAQIIHGNLKKGVDVDWDEAADQLMDHRDKSFGYWTEQLLNSDPSGKTLVNRLPKKVFEAIRKYAVAQVKSVGRQQPQAAAPTQSPPSAGEKNDSD